MTSHADVVVIGAGPAGAASAMLLARQGFEVAVLDRHAFPRPKPCGDCLSPEAGRVLDRLGLLDHVRAESPAALAGWRIFAPSGEAFTGTFARAANGDPRAATAIALDRARLDAVLVSAAERAGARVLSGVTVASPILDPHGAVIGVAGRTSDGRPAEFRARLVIGADGLRSVLARRLGLLRRPPRLRKLSLTAHVTGLPPAATVPGLGPLGEMHLARGACLGAAPVHLPSGPGRTPQEVTWNLTLVVGERSARDVAANPLAFFRRTLDAFPAFRERARRIRFLDHRVGGRYGPRSRTLLASGPFDWPTRRVVADGAALVGDAAGYFDPFTGQGIYQALASTEILAQVAGAALRAGDTSATRLEPYARRHRALVAPARRLQRIIDVVVTRPTLAELAVGRLRLATRAADALVSAAGDLHRPRDLLSPALFLDLLTGSPRPEVSHDHRR